MATPQQPEPNRPILPVDAYDALKEASEALSSYADESRYALDKQEIVEKVLAKYDRGAT